MGSRIKLSDGTTGFTNDQGVRVCTGSQMGRTPHTTSEPDKCYLSRLPLNSGGYDSGGAYWGHSNNLYRCLGEHTELYVRAGSREMARAMILSDNPKLTFYR